MLLASSAVTRREEFYQGFVQRCVRVLQLATSWATARSECLVCHAKGTDWRNCEPSCWNRQAHTLLEPWGVLFSAPGVNPAWVASENGAWAGTECEARSKAAEFGRSGGYQYEACAMLNGPTAARTIDRGDRLVNVSSPHVSSFSIQDLQKHEDDPLAGGPLVCMNLDTTDRTEALERVARLVGPIIERSLRQRDTPSLVEQEDAEAFYKATGYMPPALCPPGDRTDQADADRQREWTAWKKAQHDKSVANLRQVRSALADLAEGAMMRGQERA